jgi:hypothetical protein
VTREQRFDSFAAVEDAFEGVDARIERVKRCKLPSRVEALVDAYDQIVGIRDRFLWQWLYFILPSVTISCVDPAYEDRVRDAKLIASLFVVLLDDLGEREMDRITFEETAKVPFDHQTPNYDRENVNEEYLSFGERVWEQFETGLAEAPCENEYEFIFYRWLEASASGRDPEGDAGMLFHYSPSRLGISKGYTEVWSIDLKSEAKKFSTAKSSRSGTAPTSPSPNAGGELT